MPGRITQLKKKIIYRVGLAAGITLFVDTNISFDALDNLPVAIAVDDIQKRLLV
jgi:hypothetical protein